MISIDQIATIAGLCDYIDRAARIDSAASPFLPYYYTLKLRDFWVKKGEADRCSCGVAENEEYFLSTDELLCPVFLTLTPLGGSLMALALPERTPHIIGTPSIMKLD